MATVALEAGAIPLMNFLSRPYSDWR